MLGALLRHAVGDTTRRERSQQVAECDCKYMLSFVKRKLVHVCEERNIAAAAFVFCESVTQQIGPLC